MSGHTLRLAVACILFVLVVGYPSGAKDATQVANAVSLSSGQKDQALVAYNDMATKKKKAETDIILCAGRQAMLLMNNQIDQEAYDYVGTCLIAGDAKITEAIAAIAEGDAAWKTGTTGHSLGLKLIVVLEFFQACQVLGVSAGAFQAAGKSYDSARTLVAEAQAWANEADAVLKLYE